jgi:predicted thioredoxin/glutaredoxin
MAQVDPAAVQATIEALADRQVDPQTAVEKLLEQVGNSH